jgi:glycosyltransferase involved in cell wall biosynthesis
LARELSVVIAALDGYNEIKELLLSIERQTIKNLLEVILVCKDRTSLVLPESFHKAYSDVIVLEGNRNLLLNKARYLGVLNSTAPFVVILKDHCLPQADCFEHLLDRLKQGWSGVGPSIRNGNKCSAVARAANCVTYGQWMGRRKSGKVDFIAGYNSAFPKSLLLSRGEQLQQDLIVPSLMLSKLRAQGHKFFLETISIMVHWEAFRFSGTKRILVPQGRAMGKLRSQTWPLWRRWMYSFLSPALAAFRYGRAILAHIRIYGFRIFTAEFLYLLPITMVWTYGELTGYWTNDNSVYSQVSKVEKNKKSVYRALRSHFRFRDRLIRYEPLIH